MKKAKWFLFVIALVALLGFGEQLEKVFYLEHQRADLADSKKDLKAEIQRLEEDIVLLKDASYLEILAREDLAMIYPGETLFVETADLH